MKITITTDLGCDMTPEDIKSYVEFCKSKIREVYHVEPQIRCFGIQTVIDCEQEKLDEVEINDFLGNDVWNEWCKQYDNL